MIAVNGEPTGRFGRPVWVTFARGAVAMVPALGLAALITASGSGDSGGDAKQFWMTLAVLVAVPATWLLPVGALVDHFGARAGVTLVALLHMAGATGAFVLWLVGLYAWAILTDQPLGGPLAFLFVLLVPPWMLLGFLVSLVVPGSFPRGTGLVRDGVRLLSRAARWAVGKVRFVGKQARDDARVT